MCEKTRMDGVTFIHQCFRRNLVNTDRINSIPIPYKLLGVDEYLNIGIRPMKYVSGVSLYLEYVYSRA